MPGPCRIFLVIAKTHPIPIAARAASALAIIGLLVAAGCATAPSSNIKGIDQYVQGALASEKNHPDEAIPELEAAVAKNPDLIMARITLGDLYRQKHQYQAAADQYSAAVRLDPYWYLNYYHLGLTYQLMQKLREAAGWYLKAMNLRPTDLNSTMNLGTVYLSLGQTHDAIDLLKHAAEIDPKSAEAQANLGIALDLSGDYAGAERAYRRASELGDESPDLLLNLSANLVQQGRAREAQAAARLALDKSNSALAHMRYGDALLLDGQVDPAIEQYNMALTLEPRFYPALTQRGYVLINRYQQGEKLDERLRTAALADWRKSLQIHPDQPQVSKWIDQWSGAQPGK